MTSLSTSKSLPRRLFLLMENKAKVILLEKFFPSFLVRNRIRGENFVYEYLSKSFRFVFFSSCFSLNFASTWFFFLISIEWEKYEKKFNIFFYFCFNNIFLYQKKKKWRKKKNMASTLVKHWQFTKGCCTIFFSVAVTVAGSNNHFLSN